MSSPTNRGNDGSTSNRRNGRSNDNGSIGSNANSSASDDRRVNANDDAPDQARPRRVNTDSGATGPDDRRDPVPPGNETERATDRRSVVDREKQEYGGMKVGAGFFGWLTATGAGVLLTALLSGAGAAVGMSTNTDPAQNAETIGLVGGIALAVVSFIAYVCGGYVAGRMARFNGIKQGLVVWLWALVIAIIVAIIGAVAGQQFNILARLNSFPRIPINEGTLTTAGIITVVILIVTTLVGAILGGLAGMRFHRNVDKAGLGH